MVDVRIGDYIAGTTWQGASRVVRVDLENAEVYLENGAQVDLAELTIDDVLLESEVV